MSLKFLRRPRADEPPPVPVERPEVRQYRFLLRTAPFRDLHAYHRQALASVDPLIRAQVLSTLQERVLAGRALTVDDTNTIALLLTTAEVQTPGVVVSALTDMALARVAGAVLRLPGAVRRLDGYDDWDGADPDPRESAHRLPARRLVQPA